MVHRTFCFECLGLDKSSQVGYNFFRGEQTLKKALPALVCLVLLTPHIWTDKPASASAPPDPRFGAVEAYEAPDQATLAGVGWERILFWWYQLQPNGPEDWNDQYFPDEILDREHAQGREVVGLLNNTPHAHRYADDHTHSYAHRYYNTATHPYAHSNKPADADSNEHSFPYFHPHPLPYSHRYQFPCPLAPLLPCLIPLGGVLIWWRRRR